MLPLVITFLITVYLYAPGLVFRWFIGQAVGRENLKQPPSKVEETTQALVWVALPLIFTVVWAFLSHAWRGSGAVEGTKGFFTGLYSETSFRSDPELFWAEFSSFVLANLRVLWREYSLVVLYSVFAFVVIRNGRLLYDKEWSWRWGRRKFTASWGQRLVDMALATSPPVAEWSTLLNELFIPKDLEVHVDILVKGGTLYQGRATGYSLDAAGGLATLKLNQPRRFLYAEFHAERAKWPTTKAERYWRSIPGSIFVLSGSDIANVNIRYVQRNTLIATLLSQIGADEINKAKRGKI